MESLAEQVRKLIYTIVCFQCLLQLTQGSVYQKYLKLFSYLLTMSICCNVVFSFAGQVEQSFGEADSLYDKWEKEWLKLTDLEDIHTGKEYYEYNLWEKKILGNAQSEYDRQKGENEHVGEDFSQTEGEE